MIREEYIKEIRNSLALLVSEVQLSNSLNMQNINIISENFYRDFFNLLFDWNLKNSNYSQKNFKGIDLYSESEKVVIQVSTVVNRKKIQEAINKIDNARFNGYHFIFVAITNKIISKAIYREYQISDDIHFVPEEDIWDHTKILNYVNDSQIDKMQKIASLVAQYFDKAESKCYTHLSAPIPGDIEYFIGRENELLDISKKIKNMNPLYLWGEPGVGKTELAIRFANKYYGKVFFVTFKNSIKETIANLRFVEVEQYGDISTQYQTNLELLRKYDSETILIIDNFDIENNLDPDILRTEKEFTEIINLDLKIIITTRNDYGIGIHVQYLNKDELLSLMLHFYPHKEKSNVLKGIIKVLQYNTFTVELCARTLNTLGSMTPEQLLLDLQNIDIDKSEYKGIYIEKDRAQDGAFLRKNLVGHIRCLYQLSSLTSEEKQILSCLALLPASGINYHLFVKSLPLLSLRNGTNVLSYSESNLSVSKGNYIEYFFPLNGSAKECLWQFLTRYDDRIEDEEELEYSSEEVVDRMIQKGWIQSNQSNETIKLQPILLTIIMSEKTVRPDIEKCFDFIKHIFYMVQPEKCDMNTLIFAEYGKDILRNAIERLYLEDEIKEDIKEILTNQIFNIAIAYDNYAKKLPDDKNKNAINYHMTALKIFREIQPKGNHLAICYDNIVDYYISVEEYKLALKYAIKANTIFYSIPDVNFEDIKISNHKVGKTYAFLGEYEKQKEYYKKNIVIDLENLPPNHPEIAHDYTILSFAYGNLGDIENKIKCLQKAYKILEKLYMKNFRNNLSYPRESCLFEWINLLQGLIIAYGEKEDYEKVDLFVRKLEEKRLYRILSRYHLELKKIENDSEIQLILSQKSKSN